MSWSLGQDIRSENFISLCGSLASASTRSKTTRPEARLSAVSTESVSRRLDDGLGGEPVDDHLDGVLLLLLQLGRLGELDRLAVDAGAAEALGLEAAEELDVLALAAADHRREHLEAGALLELEHPVDDLLRRLALDRRAARRGSAAGRRGRRAGGGSRRPR